MVISDGDREQVWKWSEERTRRTGGDHSVPISEDDKRRVKTAGTAPYSAESVQLAHDTGTPLPP